MAIKAISQFDAATPTSNDKILFEQNGEGKSTTLADLPVSTKTQAALNTKVNTADVLTINQIMTSPDLSGKVASASSAKELNQKIFSRLSLINIDSEFKGTYTINLLDYLQDVEYSLVSVTVNNSTLNPDHVGEFLGFVAKGRVINTIVCQGHGEVGISITDNTYLNISKNFTWANFTVRVTVI